MREIKFRAWHKEMKLMYRVLSLVLGQREQEASLVRYDTTLVRYEGPSVTCRLDEIELMQYTGLKDCKGKKIYEGDIIKCYDGITESYFNSVIEWQIRELTHEVAMVPLEVSGFIIGSLSEVEIIGNIYENPELQEATS